MAAEPELRHLGRISKHGKRNAIEHNYLSYHAPYNLSSLFLREFLG